ncbi:hypothetical protein FKM82_005923 [Ascaphus truei]
MLFSPDVYQGVAGDDLPQGRRRTRVWLRTIPVFPSLEGTVKITPEHHVFVCVDCLQVFRHSDEELPSQGSVGRSIHVQEIKRVVLVSDPDMQQATWNNSFGKQQLRLKGFREQGHHPTRCRSEVAEKDLASPLQMPAGFSLWSGMGFLQETHRILPLL